MKRLIIANFILLTILTSCSSPKSSPKSDGERQAQEECAMWNAYVQNTTMAYTNFVKEFGSKNYQTRVQAREELNNRIDEVESHLSSQLDELNAKYKALLEKYGENQDKVEAMSRAYDKIIGAYTVDTTKIAGLRSQAYDKILTIIPPDPTMAKIRKDLVGRIIRELPGGYFNNWSWTIEAGEIKDLQITEVEKVDTHHTEILVNMTLQAEGPAYKTSGKVYYVLDDRDDWEIDMLESCEVEVVKTGRYDTCITTTLDGHLEIHNNSDAALLVGFRIVDRYGNPTKHSLVVGGGETKSYYNGYGVVDYSIDFIERP